MPVSLSRWSLARLDDGMGAWIDVPMPAGEGAVL